ncbi:RNA binding protein fox-1 homolog 2-like isoform X1 [Acipenser ruthenus]|uniref:RNA binding protein fox-1 homolog 2-like isoform X1 n=1 Tax=Acipenser ruthenus TaxID=7906 RepID=UPI0027404E9E|nr:RNA binding protein fox-1 homolog 2-like isoform X1 [Acipenser ruthenus]XP_058841172.1 RNA binding protein fox-1 homolog 2-like isoform X1 [Acipenser ruthenus]XP_058841173.1 RNA binding protein fox-1 homolog 2-like isoform X1 [Acipenser ruthenus]XP_058841174.1 RNA binding protein fox-1 homolog 2-like isoform X1 [Acipenser ruthenus]XP_058841175.1 RNA binding protein fox-1 homolog 2-like isoform X1 [Acipenser ruthenus]
MDFKEHTNSTMETIYQKRVEKSQREVYVGNIPFSVRKQEIADLFKAFNPLSIRIVHSEEKCFAFVDFANQNSAQQAISRLNDSVYEGRRIIVRCAYASRVSSHECTTFETKVKELRVKEESNGCSACSCKGAMGGRRLFARHGVEMVSDQEDENQFGLKTAVKKEKLEEKKMLLEIKKLEIEIQKLQLEIRRL